MVHNFLDPRSTGSSECAKGRQSVLVTLNVKPNKMGGESGGTVVIKQRQRVRARYSETLIENYSSKDVGKLWNIMKMILSRAFVRTYLAF